MDVVVKMQTGKKTSQSIVETYLLEKYKERRRLQGAKGKPSRHESITSARRERLVGLQGDGSKSAAIDCGNRNKMNESHPEIKRHLSKLKGIAKFKEAVRIIKVFINVCNRLISIAAEHGKYKLLTTDAHVELHTAAVSSVTDKEEQELMFDPALYKSKCETTIPRWIFGVCNENPEDRSEWGLHKLCYILKQIAVFQKYTKGMLKLMAKYTTFARFERGRVIIRKGHTGRSTYVIFKGSVAILQKDIDETNLMMNEGHKGVFDDGDDDDKSDSRFRAVLRNGDCFGREALFKCTERQATAVCLSTTYLLIINLEDVNGFGLQDYLNQECRGRQKFLRSMSVFAPLPDNIIHKLAEKSHTYEYLADKVIEDDTKSQELIYLCKRGQCSVLRKIDKKKESRPRSEDLGTMVSSFKIQTSRRKPRSELSDLAMKIVKNQSQLKGNCFALPVGAESSSHRSYSGNYLRKQKHSGSCESRLRHEKKHENFGSLEELDDGLTLKIAQISRGDIYGLRSKSIGKEGDTRKFVLVSDGCELVAIRKSTLAHSVNRETFEKLQTLEKSYASDEELYHAFQQQKQWNLYRERLVNDIVKWKGPKGKSRSDSL